MTSEEWYSGGSYFQRENLKSFFRRDGNGPALICIHGFPSSSWDFVHMWTGLTDQFDTIAIDLIGLGKSSKPKQKLSVSLQADQIESLMVDLNIEEAHILAHDLGDTVAQELIARRFNNSSKINWLSVIFLNGGIFPETHQPLFIQKLLISPLGAVLAPLMSKSTFRKNMERVFSSEHPPSKTFINDTWKLICLNEGKKMIPRLIRYMKERVTHRKRWVSPLEANVVPIRLINGVQDPISGEHAAKRFETVVPNADVIRIPDAGHYPQVETPDQVLTAFLDFHQP